MNTKLEELKKVIQVACPDLMELKEGQNIEYQGKKAVIAFKNHFGWRCYMSGDPYGLVLTDSMVQFDKTFKILGSKITISYVLRAIAKKEKLNSMPRFMSINGGFFEDGVLITSWDLSQDDIDRNPQTWDFLHELLIK